MPGDLPVEHASDRAIVVSLKHLGRLGIEGGFAC